MLLVTEFISGNVNLLDNGKQLISTYTETES